jgi:hypothetical protein
MSSLREVIAAQKAESAAAKAAECVETSYQPVSMVTFCPWQAKEWNMPWVRLDSFSFSNEQELERLELFFPNYEVIVVGENLRTIKEEIRGCTVRCLRDFPASHRAGFKPSAVFISQLEVRPIG